MRTIQELASDLTFETVTGEQRPHETNWQNLVIAEILVDIRDQIALNNKILQDAIRNNGTNG